MSPRAADYVEATLSMLAIRARHGGADSAEEDEAMEILDRIAAAWTQVECDEARAALAAMVTRGP